MGTTIKILNSRVRVAPQREKTKLCEPLCHPWAMSPAPIVPFTTATAGANMMLRYRTLALAASIVSISVVAHAQTMKAVTDPKTLDNVPDCVPGAPRATLRDSVL
jgi:hypothetical protein